MKIEEFFALLAKEFNVEIEEMNESTIFTNIPDWDSMSILVLMSMVDENFGITLSADDFNKIQKIGDLLEKIGEDKFD